MTGLRKSIETCIENDYSLRQGIAPKGIKVSSSEIGKEFYIDTST